jgi:methylthioribose-1-phosphate isomerase
MNFSPLFWPVTYNGTKISVLDESLLPEKLAYFDLSTCREACKAIQEMRTRAFGQVLLALYTFMLVAEQNRNAGNLKNVIEQAADALQASRPTLPFGVLTKMIVSWIDDGRLLPESINGFLDELREKRIRQAQRAAALIDDGDCILTHCNISGLMPLIGNICREQGKKISFIVTETRPHLQGARLTVWELLWGGCAVTVICDNMVAQVMKEKKVRKVIVGADHLAKNGDIANKIGTLQIALLANYFSLPFYVVCPPQSTVAHGNDIPIEVRPKRELLLFNGKWISDPDADAYCPVFDITPFSLITQHLYME